MSTLRQTSGSIEGLNERKRKRMISNRDSARRSRVRKQKMVEDLTSEVARLRWANNGIVGKIKETTEGYMGVLAENNALRAQAVELTERLRSLIGVIKISGLKLDVPDVPDPLLKPWQTPCPLQPIMASSEFFRG